MAVLTNCWYPLGGRHANGMAKESGRYGKVLQQTPRYTQKSMQFQASSPTLPEYNHWPFWHWGTKTCLKADSLEKQNDSSSATFDTSNWTSSFSVYTPSGEVISRQPHWGPYFYSDSSLQVSSHCPISTSVCQRSVYSLHRWASDALLSGVGHSLQLI